VISTVEAALSYHSERITRLGVHVSDQNRKKSGEADQRCAMEARLEGMPPMGVHHDAAVYSHQP
jgi:hypothetical protein